MLQKIFILSFLVISFNNYGQNKSLATGVVIDSIAVKSAFAPAIFAFFPHLLEVMV